MNVKKFIYLFLTLAVIGSFVFAAPALADNSKKGNNSIRRILNPGQPVVSGTVLAINGNTITISGKLMMASRQNSDNSTANTTTIFTIDATNAKITKNGATILVTGITIGDKVTAQGVLTGTNIVAVIIRDGQGNQGERDSGKINPVVVGKVSAINGNVLTVVSKQGTYTVDATNAKLLRGNTTITLSNIAIGDNVIVQGTVNGTSVVASTVIDQGKPANTIGNNSGKKMGLFGPIRQFFTRLFGF